MLSPLRIKKSSFRLIIFSAFIAVHSMVNSQLQVNTVSTTLSTCPNNGSISIQATTTHPPVLYSIIAGPVTQPVQTTPVFNSLVPGNYTIQISDGASNQITQNITIVGTYQNPDFTISDTTPYCLGESNGKLVSEIILGRGLAPFSWQLVAPSPVTTGPQNDGLFQHLPAGNYSIRVTDACGSFSTNTIALQNPDTEFSFLGLPVGQPGDLLAAKIGCDSMLVTYWLNIPVSRMPLTFRYETPNGIFIPTSGTTIDSTFLHTTGQVVVSQIIPGLDYGDIVTANIFNTCGDSAFSSPMVIHPFVFYPKYSFNDCGSTANLLFANTPYQNYHTSINTTAHYTFTHVSTSTLIESGTVATQQNNGIVSIAPPVISGETYHFSITDGCGQVFQGNFTVPALAPPLIIHEDIISAACIDSVVGTYRVMTSGFESNAKLIVLSGPSTLGSTKPEFEYTDTYVYPDTVNIVNGESFLLNNLTDGTYHFKIIDACGNELFDSLTITPDQLTSLERVTTYEKGCANQNKLFFSMVSGGKVTIKNLANNTILIDRDFDAYTSNQQAQSINQDSLLNVPDGSYEVTYQFLQSIGALENGTMLNESQMECWKIVDTVMIDPYEFPEIITENVIMCNDVINFVVIPDTTKGIQPYAYEIIAGPQIFPGQSSNMFTITEPGTYTVRIFDACGNASTKQITADTISFDPLEINSTCTDMELIFPSSIYFTYEWLMPNGQTHVGDSLIIHPVTPADTGIYEISKIININGCTDTLTTEYHIGLPNQFEQTIPFCSGTSVVVGSNTYNSPGIYHDTLVTVTGCDSIVTTLLTILPQYVDTNTLLICTGDSILIAGVYQSLPGFYSDSVQNIFGCYDLIVTELTHQPTLYNESVTICFGESYSSGGNTYTVSGIYSDSLQSSIGCDSVVVLQLVVLPPLQTTLNVSICQEEYYAFAGDQLTVPGIYTDTLSSFYSCDSVILLHLTVDPLKTSTITASVCEGTSFSFGGNQLTMAGTYTDTIATSTCDSIVLLHLTLLPNNYQHIYDTICEGDAYTFGGIEYTHTGTYTQTFPTNSCDSIVTLHLEVRVSPSVFITSTASETSGGAIVELGAISNTHPLTYLWESSAVLNDYTIRNPTTEIQVPTWASVTVTDQYGCQSTASYLIGVPETSTLYAPNSVTPNGDEVNNVFRVYGTNIDQFHIVIFDRWGEVIFESNDFHFLWDVTYKGKIVQDGIYVYKIFAIGTDDVIYDITGHLTVIK